MINMMCKQKVIDLDKDFFNEVKGRVMHLTLTFFNGKFPAFGIRIARSKLFLKSINRKLRLLLLVTRVVPIFVR